MTRPSPAEYFTGSVRIDPLFEAKDPARARGKKLDLGKGHGSSGGIAVQKVVAQTAIAAFNCVLWTLRSELPQRHFRVT